MFRLTFKMLSMISRAYGSCWRLFYHFSSFLLKLHDLKKKGLLCRHYATEKKTVPSRKDIFKMLFQNCCYISFRKKQLFPKGTASTNTAESLLALKISPTFPLNVDGWKKQSWCHSSFLQYFPLQLKSPINWTANVIYNKQTLIR